RAVGARVLAVQPDQSRAEGPELIDRPRLVQCSLADEFQPLSLLLFQYGERELLLGGEVEVEGAFGEAAAGDELGQRGVGVAAFGEALGRGLEDGRASGVALGCHRRRRRGQGRRASGRGRRGHAATGAQHTGRSWLTYRPVFLTKPDSRFYVAESC